MEENERVLWQDKDGTVLVHCYHGDIATFIKTERLKQGLTQAQLAEKTGVSLRTIQRYEKSGITDWTVMDKPRAVVRYLGGHPLLVYGGGHDQVAPPVRLSARSEAGAGVSDWAPLNLSAVFATAVTGPDSLRGIHIAIWCHPVPPAGGNFYPHLEVFPTPSDRTLLQ